jgi:hypothetical protein
VRFLDQHSIELLALSAQFFLFRADVCDRVSAVSD